MQIPATSLQLAAKDKQLRELEEENSMLRQQVTEMEKALQMASDYHSATQAAHQVKIAGQEAAASTLPPAWQVLSCLRQPLLVALPLKKVVKQHKAIVHHAC